MNFLKFQEFHDFMKNAEFLEFCVFEQIWLPECIIFIMITKLFCVLGDAGVDFMEFYGNSCKFIKWKKKWKCSFCKFSIKFTKMRQGLKTSTRCNGFLVVLRQRSAQGGITSKNAKFRSFCNFFMKWANFS